MSLKKYITLARYIKNWTLYFKHKFNREQTFRYITKGKPLAFDVPPAFYPIFKEMFLEDFYDFKSVVKKLKNEPVVIDIGANVGYFTFLLLAAKPQAKVYAFEPMQNNVNVFTANIALNPSIKKNILLNKQAVTGNKEGDIEIFFDHEKGDTVISSVYKDFSERNTASEMVNAVTLNSILQSNQLTNVDLLKLDCEGSEYPILYDSPAEIFSMIQAIIIEAHHLDTETRNERYLTDFLVKKGYNVTAHIGKNGCPSIRAFRKVG